MSRTGWGKGWCMCDVCPRGLRMCLSAPSPRSCVICVSLPGCFGVCVCVPACLAMCPSAGVRVWKPLSCVTQKEAGGNKPSPSRGPRVARAVSPCPPPPLAARGPGRTRGPRVHLRPGRQRTRPRPPAPAPGPPAPGQARESPRPAHLAATRQTSGSSGLDGPGTMRKHKGSGIPRDGRGSSTARVQLQLLPPSAKETIWRRAGAGPERRGGAGRA